MTIAATSPVQVIFTRTLDALQNNETVSRTPTEQLCCNDVGPVSGVLVVDEVSVKLASKVGKVKEDFDPFVDAETN